MRLEGFLARRLNLRQEGDSTLHSPGAIIAVTGIALAMIIMLLAISIVTGFKKEIRNKVTGFNAQVTIYPTDAFSNTANTSAGISLDSYLDSTVKSLAPEARAALTIKQPAIIKTDEAFQGVVLKGDCSADTRDFLASNIVEGNLPPVDCSGGDSLLNTIMVSSTTANALQLTVGEKINVHFLRADGLTTRKLKITGIYDTHFSEYDKLYAYTPPQFIQRLNKIDTIVGGAVEIRGLTTDNILPFSEALETTLTENAIMSSQPPKYIVDNVLNSGAIYFNWLDLLDTNVVVIIVLMTLVSAFTLISSLFIIILERVNTIGLLKALGATNSMIRKIFILMAERLVIRGLIWGNLIGLGLLSIQKYYHLFPLDPEAYYLNYVPVDINLWYVALVNICAILISYGVLIIPSSAISRMSPAENLRYE